MDAADYLEETDDGTVLAAAHADTDTLDIAGSDLAQLDVHCAAVTRRLRADDVEADHLYAWNLTAHRPEFHDSRFGRATLRGIASRNPVRLERVHVDGRLDLYDADVPWVDLSDAHVGDTLALRGADTGRVDLRGAAVGSIETLHGDLDDIHIVTDDDTYVHDVPDALRDDLGYAAVSDAEADVLAMAAAYDDGFTYDDLQQDYKRAVAYAGTLGPLVQRDFLAHEGDTFTLTARGRSAHRFTQ